MIEPGNPYWVAARNVEIVATAVNNVNRTSEPLQHSNTVREPERIVYRLANLRIGPPGQTPVEPIQTKQAQIIWGRDNYSATGFYGTNQFGESLVRVRNVLQRL